MVYLHLSISYPVLLTLFAVAAILNTSPSSLETRDPAVCQGLLPSRRHIGSREDPGDEVGHWVGSTWAVARRFVPLANRRAEKTIAIVFQIRL